MEEAIRLRAYRLWEAAGRPEGDGVEFWRAAEKVERATAPGGYGTFWESHS